MFFSLMRDIERIHLAQKLLHTGIKHLKAALCCARTRYYDIKTAPHLWKKRAYTFTQASFGTVAYHGYAYFFAHRKANALLIAANIQQAQFLAGGLLSAAVHVVELPVGPQSVLLLQGLPSSFR